MASILKVDKIRGTGLDSDSISLDVSGNITFNTSVSGTGYDLLANVYSDSTVTSTEIALPTGYDSYYLQLTALGDYSSEGNMCLTNKREGESSFDTSDYTTQCKLQDLTNSQVNANSSYAFMILSSVSSLNSYFAHNIYLNNYGRTDVASAMTFLTSKSKSGASSTWVGGGAHTTEANNLARVSAVKYSPAYGNITRIQYKLFGIA